MINTISTLRRAFRIIYRQPSAGLPLYVCCHHKVASKLLRKVFRRVCRDFGWEFGSYSGFCAAAPTNAHVVVFDHSLVDLSSVGRPFAAVHVVRDPRDVIISGYLYHIRCTESWCTNGTFDVTRPILYPLVPRSQEHRSEEWKEAYLRSLHGKSYQENLQGLSQDEGILFEMDRYGAWTVEEMLRWTNPPSGVREVKFEDIMQDFESTFRLIFEHFHFTPGQVESSLAIAAAEDINRMSDRQLTRNTHISSRSTSRWQEYFTEEHKAAFVNRFGDVLQRLGYEQSNDW